MAAEDFGCSAFIETPFTISEYISGLIMRNSTNRLCIGSVSNFGCHNNARQSKKKWFLANHCIQTKARKQMIAFKVNQEYVELPPIRSKTGPPQPQFTISLPALPQSTTLICSAICRGVWRSSGDWKVMLSHRRVFWSPF